MNYKSRIKSIFYLLSALFFVLSLIILFFIFLWDKTFLPLDPFSVQLEIFVVSSGQGAKEISENLQKQGLIKYGFLFQAYVFFTGRADDLQAGDYELSRVMAIPEIAEKISSGNRIKRMITIIEGWDLSDVENELKEKGFAGAEKIFEIEKQKKIEGYLFPDTYEIFLEEGVAGAVNKMLANFEEKITQGLREEIEAQGKSLSDIIIMASLIEKEVRTMADKKTVSGVLWKRMGIGMPLQVDAAIAYIKGGKITKISLEDLKIDSPYNTYKNKGLPQGPICSPGLDSIIAAIYPQKTSYFYYLSTPAGRTIFSATLAEHNAAKNRYLR